MFIIFSRDARVLTKNRCSLNRTTTFNTKIGDAHQLRINFMYCTIVSGVKVQG